MSTQTNNDQESPNRRSAKGEDESPAIPPDWLAEFEAAARRPLEVRMRYSFIHTYKPVLDDASYRSFDTMEDYRRWCEENLPSWLGYGRV
jgi:hypothetical protein